MTPRCQNCERPLQIDFIYCPACGQKSETRRLKLQEILVDAWTQFSDIDRGFFRLLRDLVTQPGIVAREYIGGKRKKYFAPLNFYLIVGTVLIVIMNLTGRIYDAAHPDSPAAVTRPEKMMQSVYKLRQEKVDAFWAQYSDLVSIGAAPLLSLFFWLFYRRAGFNYAELLVASLYMIGFTNLVFALIISPVSAILSPTQRPSQAIIAVFKIFEVSYFTWFYYQFAHDKARRPLMRAALSSILASLLWSALTVSLVAFYIMTGFAW